MMDVIRDKYMKRLQQRSKIVSMPINAGHSMTPGSYEIWKKKRLKLRKYRK